MSDAQAASQQRGEVLSLQGLSKTYAGVQVVKHVNLTFEAGKVHALLGPNGSGKSTLLGCVSGAVTPDDGTIRVSGATHKGFTPTVAFQSGIAIIYQHFQLIPELSISDNVFLGSELKTVFGNTKYSAQERRTAAILRELQVDLEPSRLVSSLSMGEKQVVEIARALRHEPSILILDEPTAALSEHETAALLELVKRLATDRGLAVIYVTHLLREVMQVANSVSMLRDGELMWTRSIGDLTLEDLIAGISPGGGISRTNASGKPVGREMLALDNYRSRATGPITLKVHAGEIVGIFGLLGSGRTDLLEGMAGIRRSVGGAMRVSGKEVHITSPRSALQSGIVLVSSDRQAHSVFGQMSAAENMLLPHYKAIASPFRSRRRELDVFLQTAKHVGLVPLEPARQADTFSGGNAQKLAVGRWLTGLQEAPLLLLDEPTQGVDVGARRDLYRVLRERVRSGERAVIFVSSDSDEIVALADRVVILADGALVDVIDASIGEDALLALAHH